MDIKQSEAIDFGGIDLNNKHTANLSAQNTLKSGSGGNITLPDIKSPSAYKSCYQHPFTTKTTL